MANINLSTNQLNGTRKKPPMANTGTTVALVFLLIIVGASVFLVVREKSLMREIASTEKKYDEKRAELTEGRNMDVIDLQSRIFKLKDLVGQRNAALDSMQNVEKLLVSGVMVKNFNYNNAEKVIKLDFIAENHDIVARQIANLKSFEFFSDVNLESTKIAAAGGIDFVVTITSK